MPEGEIYLSKQIGSIVLTSKYTDFLGDLTTPVIDPKRTAVLTSTINNIGRKLLNQEGYANDYCFFMNELGVELLRQRHLLEEKGIPVPIEFFVGQLNAHMIAFKRENPYSPNIPGYARNYVVTLEQFLSDPKALPAHPELREYASIKRWLYEVHLPTAVLAGLCLEHFRTDDLLYYLARLYGKDTVEYIGEDGKATQEAVQIANNFIQSSNYSIESIKQIAL